MEKWELFSLALEGDYLGNFLLGSVSGPREKFLATPFVERVSCRMNYQLVQPPQQRNLLIDKFCVIG